MDRSEKEAWIRKAAQLSRQGHDVILWSRHAVARLAMAALSRPTIETALVHGEVIEEYPQTHRPLPDCLVLALLEGHEPVHAVVAIDEANTRLVIVTVYRPDPARWLDERTRRPR